MIRKILSILFAVLLVSAFALLITAMIFHAVEGNNSDAAVVLAIICAALSLTGLVILIIKGKGKGEKNENTER